MSSAAEPPSPAAAALLDVKLLRLFDALHATGSVTRAAERLGLSQPTVSIGLARLREALHDPLFVRTPAGMQPTPRADELVATAREALAALQRLALPPAAFVPAESQRSLRVCMTDASSVTLLPALLARLHADAPRLRLEVARIDAATARALRDGEVDLGLGLIPELDAGFYQQTLFEQDWVCLTRADLVRPGARLTARAYREGLHVAVAHGSARRLLDAALQRHGVTRQVRVQVPGFLGLPAVVAATGLIATLPRRIGEFFVQGTGLAVHACPVPMPTFTVKQHWHARQHHDPANRWLRGVCAELFMQQAVRRPVSPAADAASPPRARRRRPAA